MNDLVGEPVHHPDQVECLGDVDVMTKLLEQ